MYSIGIATSGRGWSCLGQDTLWTGNLRSVISRVSSDSLPVPAVSAEPTKAANFHSIFSTPLRARFHSASY